MNVRFRPKADIHAGDSIELWRFDTEIADRRCWAYLDMHYNEKAIETQMKRPVFWLWAFGLLLMVNGASATGSMRCGGRIVDQGMTKDEVIQLCGAPTVRKEGDSYWFYDGGSEILITRLFFVGDKVEFIDDVSRDEM